MVNVIEQGKRAIPGGPEAWKHGGQRVDTEVKHGSLSSALCFVDMLKCQNIHWILFFLIVRKLPVSIAMNIKYHSDASIDDHVSSGF